MIISIIIPSYNESEQIRGLIESIKQADKHNLVKEIIVADGGSTDNTCEIAAKAGASVLEIPKKGRAAQMNFGADHARGKILYFLHADTFPPVNFPKDIIQSVEKGFAAGCYRLSFDMDHWFLKAHSWFTRFNVNGVRFGDQSLFVVKNLFHEAGGFDEELLMMEDQEIIGRIRKRGKFKVLPDEVVTSARKYQDNGIYRLQSIFSAIWLLYYLGCPQQTLLKLHRKLIHNHKL
jgi:rSAM/selenodomain-associated transferase 2